MEVAYGFDLKHQLHRVILWDLEPARERGHLKKVDEDLQIGDLGVLHLQSARGKDDEVDPSNHLRSDEVQDQEEEEEPKYAEEEREDYACRAIRAHSEVFSKALLAGRAQDPLVALPALGCGHPALRSAQITILVHRDLGLTDLVTQRLFALMPSGAVEGLSPIPRQGGNVLNRSLRAVSALWTVYAHVPDPDRPEFASTRRSRGGPQGVCRRSFADDVGALAARLCVAQEVLVRRERAHVAIPVVCRPEISLRAHTLPPGAVKLTAVRANALGLALCR